MASRGCVDLDFEAKKLGIVGLYLSAPEMRWSTYTAWILDLI